MAEERKSVHDVIGNCEYIGETVNGMRHGVGTFIKKDSDKVPIYTIVEARWVNGKIVNPVNIVYSNGAKYEGEVLEDASNHFMRFGKGKSITPSGYCHEGLFSNDGFTGVGASMVSKNELYRGDWIASKPDGKGTLYIVDGNGIEIRKGYFFDGRFLDHFLTQEMFNDMFPKLNYAEYAYEHIKYIKFSKKRVEVESTKEEAERALDPNYEEDYESV